MKNIKLINIDIKIKLKSKFNVISISKLNRIEM